LGKNGLTLAEAQPDPPLPPGAPDKRKAVKNLIANGAVRLDRNMTMADFADFAGRFVDRPVVDMTGTQATYKIAVDIPLDSAKQAADNKMTGRGTEAPRSNSGFATDPSASPIFAIVQKLGLKLEPRKAPMLVLTIDHAQRTPTEN